MEQQKRRAARGRERMIGGMLAMVGVLLVLGFWFITPRTDHDDVSPVLVSSHQPSSLPFPSVDIPPEMDVRAVLHVKPSDARVWVKGAAAKVEDGRVVLEGAPGDVLDVTVGAGGDRVTREVVVTATGETRPRLIVVR